jgi:hypothetical protein
VRKHLSYANVMATIAVFVALGGSAIAAGVIITKPSQVKNGVLTGKKLKRGTLGADRLSAAARASLQGKPGATGPAGADGAPGASGPQGPAGANGAAGEQGAQGFAGAQGPQGLKGDQGRQGEKGDQGRQGEPGIPGRGGPTGPAGPPGPAGPQGTPGRTGSTGPTGPKGGALAYAQVIAVEDFWTAPVFVGDRTEGFAAVTRPFGGVYCLSVDPDIRQKVFYGDGSPIRPAIATVEFAHTDHPNTDGPFTVYVDANPMDNPYGDWCPRHTIEVQTYDGPTRRNHVSFTVMLP